MTAVEWEWLGFAALEELTFEVARKAFQRSENITLLNLIDNLQERLDSGEKRLSILGDILAYRGRYADAARNFRVAGRDDRALNLYIDLRMFNKAQEFVGEGEGGAALARRRAEWARHVNEPRAAAEMYLAAGDVQKAAQIMAETGKRDMLIELVRKLDKAASGPLRHVAEALVAVGDPTTAADVYERLGDFKKVAELAVLAGEWTRAFSLAKEHIECRAEVYIPYAHRMARDNNFVDAQKAYHMAGETSMALRVFAILVGNAISEERFSDAGYLHHLLAMQCLETANTKEKTERARLLNRYYDNDRLSRMYHAYDAVHRCIHEPFSLSQPDALLNAARYVLSLLGSGSPPIGISIFCLNLCLAKQAKALNASAIAKQTLDKILGLQIPQKFQESVELLILKTRAGGFPNSASSERLPLRDEEVAPLCWRCRRHAPLLSVLSCPHCKHYMAHSHATHEVLPLVQFIPAEGISDSEAIELLERTSLPETSENENIQNGTEILTFDEPIDHVDPFLEKVEEGDDSGVVLCSRQALLDLNPASVLIINLPPPLNKKFYRNMLPELPIIACQYCYKLFYMEDFEIQLVTKGQCPFCRHSSSTEISKDVDNNLEDSTNDDSMHPTSPINGLC